RLRRSGSAEPLRPLPCPALPFQRPSAARLPLEFPSMSLEDLKNALPEFAKDLKLNLSSLATEQLLNEQQKAGTCIAPALASRDAQVTKAITAEFGPKLSPEALNAAKAAAAIMGMNNIYYRFVHLVGGDYKT